MRVLTVRQPWAWAIIHGGKDVENRVRNIAGDYRGPVAIHAGVAPFEQHSMASEAHAAAHGGETDTRLHFGALIGVVDLADVHLCIGECSPWALPTMQEPLRRDWWHLELANPRALAEPIPFRGALGLRRLDDEMVARIEGAIA